MWVLSLLQGHFWFATKITSSLDRLLEIRAFGMLPLPMPLPWNPMRSSVLTSSIVPFGRKPGELATRNHVQPPEQLDKIDERQGGFQFNHCVQICGGVFCCSLCAFVWWLRRANGAADCHDSASSSLESSLNSKKASSRRL